MTKRWIATFRKGTLISKQVDAILIPGIPGIFLNEYPGKSKWVITHRGTGLRLGDYMFNSRRAAKTVAIMLTESMDIDWTVKSKTELLSAHPDLEKKLVKIIKDNKISVERGPI